MGLSTLSLEIDLSDLFELLEHRLADFMSKVERSAPAKEKEFLTRGELAALIGVTTRQVDYMRKSGRLPWIKQGRRVLFKTEDIRRWLEQGYVSAGGVK